MKKRLRNGSKYAIVFMKIELEIEMMNKTIAKLTIRVPRDLKDRIEKAAEQQGVSMNPFAIYAFTREISSLETASFFQRQYAGKSAKGIFEDFDAVMKKVGKGELPEWDRMESQ